MTATAPQFSLLRRYNAGRRLSGHVQGELRAGRPLSEVMDDEFVRATVTRVPEALEDLLDDREVREELACARPERASAIVGYDGTPAARRAVERAAVVMPGARVRVVHVWKGVEPADVLFSPGQLTALPSLVRTTQDLEAGARESALARAEEGGALARALGLDAEGVAVKATKSVWDTLVAKAMEFEADVVVIGTRVRSCSQALLAGSVAHDASADRRIPVLVVPAAERVARPSRPPRPVEQEVGRVASAGPLRRVADASPLPLPLPSEWGQRPIRRSVGIGSGESGTAKAVPAVSGTSPREDPCHNPCSSASRRDAVSKSRSPWAPSSRRRSTPRCTWWPSTRPIR